ncbi:PREDICTED: NADH dehydrogenase [ubiquinone] 1 beta subcomplex subunit 5, mitochondrial [Nicrophorus vespilloides]|uniref:NADH dehydrogenase [ubiquinone] 1 beta subcomplex subunit 5, mitochondrial n=1 Tax=Nicrophorus vespilloides TaxID=110193 RepID=A0ABM1M310_NICVS|nr:PREDICTED: NADH dehydrogenase [ubiquinone] 1 beta subcomplex subunit 5, mitochondrial [Nicrophorus vespilloides]
MVNWSAFRPLLTSPFLKNALNGAVKRNMSDHRVIPMQPSKWQWNKFKDLMNFYVLLGVIPLGAITLGTNIFIGPATLTKVPEDYTPKYWEYYRHPITRFIARYILNDPQQDYEKYLHMLYEESERARLRQIERMILNRMEKNEDYQAYYYRPVLAKYHRMSKDAADYLKTIRGD